jgi:translation initiation factor 3 subunit A
VADASADHTIDPDTLTDLEAGTSPDSIMMAATQTTVENSDISDALKFLWETYKISLDLLKHNGKMLNVYQNIVKHAFDFCKQYKRKNECRRLCEALRLHLQGAVRARKQM